MKGLFSVQNFKISIIIKNVFESEGTLMHKAERPSDFFLAISHKCYLAYQIKTGVICAQIPLEIH